MNTETKPLTINQAMIKIMRSVEAIKKEKTNTQGGSFKYRGIDDVMNSLHESFAEAGVFITVDVLERNEVERTSKAGGALFYVTQKIQFTFHAEDGSSVCSVVNGTAMDSGDKADNKGLSIGLKYALLQAFLIPTEDMAEPDKESHEVKPEPKKPEPKKPEPKPTTSGPVEMTEKAWIKCIERLNAGEKIIPLIEQNYILTPEQLTTLKLYK